MTFKTLGSPRWPQGVKQAFFSASHSLSEFRRSRRDAYTSLRK